MTLLSCRALAFVLAAALLPLPAMAQTQTDPQSDPQDDQQDYSEIVVTAAKVRQGGAQDIKHFRSVAAEVGMPRPEALTVEGLMGEHDLTLPAANNCSQTFCLVTEAMPAALPGRAADRLFVGLGFTSNVDAEKWHRAPLNLVAVVDQSGSMDGPPLAMVRASLRQIVSQMRAGDRMSIILYGEGSHIHLNPTDYAGHGEALDAAIDAIRSEGSTNMEAGLSLGYQTAFADAPAFKGNTRMMLFTDEQPNVGRTDAGSFMAMAEQASQRGIGLTTIGVGVQFGDELGTRMSSVRGGNMFFVSNDAEVKETFSGQLDTMVSELAHDLKMTLSPAAGYRISGVFGVPAGAMAETPEGAIEIKVPSVFLSTNGGGIFVTMANAESRANLPLAPLGEGKALLNVGLSYNAAATGKAESDSVAVAGAEASPSAPLRQAHLLVDEYLTLRDASTDFHMKNNPKAAYAALSGLAVRLKGSGLKDMDKEEKLVGDMMQKAGFYSGYGGEPPKSLRHLAVVGTWEITGAQGFEDLHRGDRVAFTPEREFQQFDKKSGFDEPSDSEDYEINENEIHLVNSRLVMRYNAKGDRMTMYTREGGYLSSVSLRRVD